MLGPPTKAGLQPFREAVVTTPENSTTPDPTLFFFTPTVAGGVLPMTLLFTPGTGACTTVTAKYSGATAIS